MRDINIFNTSATINGKEMDDPLLTQIEKESNSHTINI